MESSGGKAVLGWKRGSGAEGKGWGNGNISAGAKKGSVADLQRKEEVWDGGYNRNMKINIKIYYLLCYFVAIRLNIQWFKFSHNVVTNSLFLT